MKTEQVLWCENCEREYLKPAWDVFHWFVLPTQMFIAAMFFVVGATNLNNFDAGTSSVWLMFFAAVFYVCVTILVYDGFRRDEIYLASYERVHGRLVEKERPFWSWW